MVFPSGIHTFRHVAIAPPHPGGHGRRNRRQGWGNVQESFRIQVSDIFSVRQDEEVISLVHTSARCAHTNKINWPSNDTVVRYF
jgi:hypothetical protein